jgi:Metallo-beta-lactamase superfamily
VLGFVSREDVASGRVTITAPRQDFDRLALGENVNAGNVIGRRAQYFFGELLPSAERGFVTCGIGTALAVGTLGYLSPTPVDPQRARLALRQPVALGVLPQPQARVGTATWLNWIVRNRPEYMLAKSTRAPAACRGPSMLDVAVSELATGVST